MKTKSGKDILVIQPKSLYKWAKNFKRIQDRFYKEPVKLRRILQIEDFVKLNGYKKIFYFDEVIIDLEISKDFFVTDIKNADLILITDQKFSRFPCSGIIDKIKDLCAITDIYICLNRHYINITNEKINLNLPDDFQEAITSWLKQSLPEHIVVDISRNYIDLGKSFTWSCPDRHYFIKRIK